MNLREFTWHANATTKPWTMLSRQFSGTTRLPPLEVLRA